MKLEIFTGYYANLRKYLAGGCVPIGISVGTPEYLKGNPHISYLRKLAPAYSMLRIEDEAEYTQRYREEILGRLNVRDVIMDIARIVYERKQDSGAAVLLCYEKPPKFCHRSLVAEWINQSGVFRQKVTEYGYEKVEPPKQAEQMDLFGESQGG